MKEGIKVLPVQQVFLEPIPGLTPGLPPLNGWTAQYVSGIEGATHEPGHFLSKWQPFSLSRPSRHLSLFCLAHELLVVSGCRRSEIVSQ